MLGSIVRQMTAPAQSRQVARCVVGGVVVQMRGGQDHAAQPERRRRRKAGERWCRRCEHVDGRQPRLSAALVAPAKVGFVPPLALGKLGNPRRVRPPALLAPAARAPKADGLGELLPVERIERALVGPDGHVRTIVEHRLFVNRKWRFHL